MSKESAIEVVGGEIIGEKAGMLREHEGLIAEVGLQIPPTTVIASEALEPFRVVLEKGREVAAEQLGELAAQAAAPHADSPVIAIRSSAEGDARGTGVYTSSFAGNRPDSAASSLLSVLRSFHNGSTANFREQAGLGQDFAVIFQPAVGQVLAEIDAGRVFGPPLSGFGYSRTRLETEGVINVVAGLGGGVDRAGGERIEPSDIMAAKAQQQRSGARADEVLTMEDFITAPRTPEVHNRKHVRKTDFRDARLKQTLGTAHSIGLRLTSDGAVAEQLSFYQAARDYDIEMLNDPDMIDTDTPFGKAIRSFKPEELMEALHSMQEIAGYPVYIEWAGQIDGDELKTFVVQIAPMELAEHSRIESDPPKNLLAVGEDVIGHGTKTASKIFYCANPQDIATLAKFNQDPENEGYILVYSSHISSADRIGALHFSFIDNAGVILVDDSGEHKNGTPLDHLGGRVDMTGKFFGSLDYDKNSHEQLFSQLYEVERVGASARIVEGEFKVIADQVENRIIIGTD